METRLPTIASPRFETQHKDLREIIDERRATSHFTDEPVPAEDIEEILKFAGKAPSGYNLQPWRFLVLREQESRDRLRAAAFDQEKISEAPVVIAFLGMKEQTKKWAKEVFEEGNRRGLGKAENNDKIIQEATALISNLGWEVWVNRHVMIAFGFAILMSEWLGYDTAPMEGFDADAVKRAFEIPKEAEVIALLAIGHVRKPDKKNPGRFPVERLMYSEKFGEPWK